MDNLFERDFIMGDPRGNDDMTYILDLDEVRRVATTATTLGILTFNCISNIGDTVNKFFPLKIEPKNKIEQLGCFYDVSNSTKNTVKMIKSKKSFKRNTKTQKVSLYLNKAVFGNTSIIEYKEAHVFNLQSTFHGQFSAGRVLPSQIKNLRIRANEVEANVVYSYLMYKREYQNPQYGINALAKVSQDLYETGNYSSPLFNYASNISGVKAMHGEPNYYLVHDDGVDCRKEDGKYSRFLIFLTPEASMKYTCINILGKSRYKNARAHYDNAEKWIKGVHDAGYATGNTYSKVIISAKFKQVKKILDKYKISY